MSVVLSVKIVESEIDYIQYLHFDKEYYGEVIKDILLERRTKGYEFSKENYDYFIEEHKQSRYKYSLATQELMQKYAPEYVGSNSHQVVFNFVEHTMEVQEGGMTCGCN